MSVIYIYMYNDVELQHFLHLYEIYSEEDAVECISKFTLSSETNFSSLLNLWYIS